MAVQLQEFAKQVLFGTTLEEKLGFPREAIVDTARDSPIKTPKDLARPDHLSLREDGVRARHPSQGKLVKDRERGKLLHFFANHELLATELMALALLKFPDAPTNFRQGLLQTLKEEQIHTRMYIHRMKQCGVEFGELPLSDYFWKSVSTMEDPLDYVTRLSLTFEQANLDYSREYKTIFQKLGDESTASILDKIYRDEIEHVGFGLKWFRQWKASGKTDWDAYKERLAFPLSPARAKGNLFNAAGRKDVGLEPAFIENLQLYSQSRGRTPSIHWFNPDCERFAAQDSATEFQWGCSKLQNDLGLLPAYLCKRDDILLLGKRPSQTFLSKLQGLGISLPELLVVDSNECAAPQIDRKVGKLQPWAWTPDSLAFYNNSFNSLTRNQAKDTLWNSRIRQLYSKSWSASFGALFETENFEENWSAPADVYGRPVTSLSELTCLRQHYHDLGYADIVCKAPFSTAANGLRCVTEGEEVTYAMLKWLDSIWRNQETVVVEPWLNRVFDFSVQFERSDNNLKLVGFTRLVNNSRGQFRGIITNGFSKNADPELVRFLMKRIGGRPRIYKWFGEKVCEALATALDDTSFQGPLGIDAFVYRNPSGDLKLKSIVEINPRLTMGRIAHELGLRNAGSSVGFFQILTKSQLKKTPHSTFEEYCNSWEKTHPIEFSLRSEAQFESGSFPLVDPGQATDFMALYHLRKRIDELPV